MKRLLIALVITAPSGSVLAGPSAEDLYSQGQSAYDSGEYALAIAKWQRSYVRSGATGLLFNIAQAYRLSGDCTQALTTYKRFIELDPMAEKRALATDFINELEPRCGAAGAPTQAPHVDRQNAARGRTLRLAGLELGGGGVVLLTIGVAFGIHASAIGDDVTRACSGYCHWAEQKDSDAAGRRDAAIGYALDVIGVAAIMGGATLYYLGNRKGAITVSPRARDGGAVVVWGRSW